MSSYTPSGLPFEARQYRCERHPVFEDPLRCSTCAYNRRQRQLDRERAAASRSAIDRATLDYGTSLHRRNLEQDIARLNPNYYGELRSSARDPLYRASGSAAESCYKSYDYQRDNNTGIYYQRDRDTGYGVEHPTRSNRYDEPDQYSNRYGDFRYENSASCNPTTVRYAGRPSPDNRDLDSTGLSARRNGFSLNSGNSGGTWSASHFPQQ